MTPKGLKSDWTTNTSDNELAISWWNMVYDLVGRQKTHFITEIKFDAKRCKSKRCKEKRRNSVFDWKKIVTTDETQFQASSGRLELLRRTTRPLYSLQPNNQSSKIPGRAKSISVFGAIWHTGLRVLFRVGGMLGGEQCIKVLLQKVIPLLTKNLLLQQDNATCLTSKAVRNFMKEEGVALLPE